MTEMPRKTLTLKRKPPVEAVPVPSEHNQEDNQPKELKRQGKRIIRRDELNVAPASRGKSGPPPRKPGKSPAAVQEPSGPPPSEIIAKTLDQRLCDTFPSWAEFKPLAHGIEEALYQFMEENQPPASKRVIQRLLRMHCNHGKYLQAVIDNQTRFTLQGEATGEITPPEHEHAVRTLESYEQRKQKTGSKDTE